MTCSRKFATWQVNNFSILCLVVTSTAGRLGPAAKTFHKRIALLIAEKHDQPYSLTFFWLCAKSSFSLLRSGIMCLRGSRLSCH